ncbi:MAG TPA: hypothetical protein VMG12_36670 [Polyangiaceae bacterium]|nr:hypothetical protein [Polyangiaceae bacterium]
MHTDPNSSAVALEPTALQYLAALAKVRGCLQGLADAARAEGRALEAVAIHQFVQDHLDEAEGTCLSDVDYEMAESFTEEQILAVQQEAMQSQRQDIVRQCAVALGGHAISEDNEDGQREVRIATFNARHAILGFVRELAESRAESGAN